jgi:hypothetical protein
MSTLLMLMAPSQKPAVSARFCRLVGIETVHGLRRTQQDNPHLSNALFKAQHSTCQIHEFLQTAMTYVENQAIEHVTSEDARSVFQQYSQELVGKAMTPSTTHGFQSFHAL